MIYQKKHQKCHLKSGDFVFIQSGDNRGKIGKILSINKRKLKALISFQNNSIAPLFIHISNLSFYDITLSQFSRVGYIVQNNKKERYLKKGKNTIKLSA